MNRFPKSLEFRGWWVLAGLFLVYATTNGILTHTLPLLHPELMAEFGWDAAKVTLPAGIYYIITAVTSPPAGVLLDRFSPRLLISVGLTGIVLGLATYSQVTQFWQLMAVYVWLGLSLSLCGLGSNLLILTRWFETYRGLAMGILLMASSLGAALFPQVLGPGIEYYGWRDAILILSVIAAIIVFFPMVLLVRNSPIDFGLNRDGTVLSHSDTQSKLARGPTLRFALTQGRFYLIAVATAAVWFCVIAMLQHQPIYIIQDLGFDRHLYPTVMTTFALFSVAGKLTFGYLSDRLDQQITMILAVATLAMAFLLLRQLNIGDTRLTFVYAALAGIGFSGAFTMTQVLIAKYYAGMSYAKILGTFILLDSLAGALGNYAVGKLRGLFDSYLPAIDLMMGACLVSIIAVYVLSRTKQPLSNE